MFLPLAIFLINKGNTMHKEKGAGFAIKIWKWIFFFLLIVYSKIDVVRRIYTILAAGDRKKQTFRVPTLCQRYFPKI